jgi:hypothetical protein
MTLLDNKTILHIVAAETISRSPRLGQQLLSAWMSLIVLTEYRHWNHTNLSRLEEEIRSCRRSADLSLWTNERFPHVVRPCHVLYQHEVSHRVNNNTSSPRLSSSQISLEDSAIRRPIQYRHQITHSPLKIAITTSARGPVATSEPCGSPNSLPSIGSWNATQSRLHRLFPSLAILSRISYVPLSFSSASGC